MSMLPKDFYMYYEAIQEAGAEVLDSSDTKTVYLDVPMGIKSLSAGRSTTSMTPKTVIVFTCHGNTFALFRSTFTNVFFKSDRWYIKPCIKDEGKNHTIYVCKLVENFLVKNVSDVHKFVNNNAKLKLIESVQKMDAQFLTFDNYGLLENENPLKNFQITFINEKFYISDNTIHAFIKRLKKLDSTLIHDTSKWGKLQNARLIMIRSSVLDQQKIKDMIKEFVKNYDWLKMDVVVTKYA